MLAYLVASTLVTVGLVRFLHSTHEKAAITIQIKLGPANDSASPTGDLAAQYRKAA